MAQSARQRDGAWAGLRRAALVALSALSVLALACSGESDALVPPPPAAEPASAAGTVEKEGGEAVGPESETAQSVVASEPTSGVAPGDSEESAADSAAPGTVDAEEANGTEREPAAPSAPDPAPDPAPEPAVIVSPERVRQGETALVRVSGVDAAAARLTVGEFSAELVREGDAWVGYVPVAPLSATGVRTVVADFFEAGGAYRETLVAALEVVDAEAGIEAITLLPGQESLLAPDLVAIDVQVRHAQFVEVSGPRRWVGAWGRPVPGEDIGRFGVLRSYNQAPPRDWHHGHDIAAPEGAPIVAPAAGVVAFADELPVHGLGVILDHGAGVYSGYWHMSALAVEAGVAVGAGEALGFIGHTGLAVGPHLHWEVIVHGQDVDPLQWLGEELSR